jgi:hypothetical protein
MDKDIKYTQNNSDWELKKNKTYTKILRLEIGK